MISKNRLRFVQTRVDNIVVMSRASCHASVPTCLTSSGAIHASDSSVFIETGTVFMSNVASAGAGGGMHVSSSVMALNGTIFKENRGATGGGWSSPTL